MLNDWQPIKYPSVAGTDWFLAQYMEKIAFLFEPAERKNIIIDKHAPILSERQHKHPIYVPIPDLPKLGNLFN